ncbi:MAG: PAS domain S-box-containing protein [Halieaceae bacterium]
MTQVSVSAYSKWSAIIVLGVILMFGWGVVTDPNFEGTPRLHMLREIFGALLAFFAGMLAMRLSNIRQSSYFLFIALGLLGAGFLDGYHLLVTSETLSPYITSRWPALAPWSWMASRLFLSIMLALSLYIFHYEQRKRVSIAQFRRTLYRISILLLLACILFFAILPPPSVYFVGGPMPQPQELGPALLFLLALVGYLVKGRWWQDNFEFWLVQALIVSVVAQALTMPFAETNFDAYFASAHFFKVMSYLLILVGLALQTLQVFQSEMLNRSMRLEAIVEMAADAIITMDSDGKVETFNPAAELMFGYTSGEVVGQDMQVLMPAAYRRGHKDGLQNYLDTGKAKVIGTVAAVEGRRKDGSLIPIELVVSGMKVDGEQMFTGILRDVSERKHAEEKLLAAKEDAEKANAAKSQFMVSMSHELRTPLNAILGFSELLEMQADARAPDQQKFAHNIHLAGRKLLQMITEVLDLSTIEAGNLALDIQPVEIAALVEDSVTMSKSALADKVYITIENTIKDTKLRVQGDSRRIQQVLINLLGNAIKYNRGQGWVKVSSLVQREGWLRIQVEDSGAGIAGDKLPLLFEPFERLEQVGGVISGTGVGLSIAKQLVEAMHGTIGVESAEGEGSTFWFELRLTDNVADGAERKTAVAAEDSHPSHPREARPFIVLYIEDYRLSVELMERALENLPGVELLLARTAEEGLEIVNAQHLDLILMDMMLPGMNGLEATTIIKQNEATRNIPVVALSGNAFPEDIELALSKGCQGYLVKPVAIKDLYAVIDEIRQKPQQS